MTMDIPNIPYDNWYKFLTIFGLVLFLIGTLFPIISLIYIRDKYSKDIVDHIKYEANIQSLDAEYNATVQKKSQKFLEYNLSITPKMLETDLLLKNFSSLEDELNGSFQLLKALSDDSVIAKENIEKSGCYDLVKKENSTIYRLNNNCSKELIANNYPLAISLLILQMNYNVTESVTDKTLLFENISNKIIYNYRYK